MVVKDKSYNEVKIRITDLKNSSTYGMKVTRKKQNIEWYVSRGKRNKATLQIDGYDIQLQILDT